MSRFIANLLDMTRLEAGAIQLRREAVDVSEVIGTAVQRTAGLLKDFKIVFDIEPNLPLLNLDEVLMEQVLVNVFDNAAKYALPPSSITIRAKKERASVRIEIADEGPGIPPERLSLIFEKFHRVKSRDHQRAGTGLGLAICRGFVEAMGGTITAANRTDRRGAVFTIEMPMAPAAQPRHAEAPA